MQINTAAKGEPVYLNEKEFRAWIERSSLKYHLEADKLVKEAIAAIKSSSDKKELDLAIEKLSQARLVSQHSFIYANSTHDITNTKLTGWQVPFKWAPSPGARNAYEAYIYVRRVSGLEPGVYHYAGSTHSLMRLKTHDLPSIGDLLANQDNLDNAAVVIFLVAQFDRPMWKYPHPNGYRTILIEAGHIAQNILLTAAKRGVASLPTCATNDAEVRRFLGLNLVRQAPVHAVVLGVSANSFCDDTVPISMDASVRAEDDDG
jgi:SagB-type dehydrogenase family enzyme